MLTRISVAWLLSGWSENVRISNGGFRRYGAALLGIAESDGNAMQTLLFGCLPSVSALGQFNYSVPLAIKNRRD